jgi:hypothetical protein
METPQAAVTKAAKWAFIPDWKYAHKFFSVEISIAGGILSGLWVAIPAFQYLIPPIPYVCFCIGVSVAVVVARMIDQPATRVEGDPNA